MTGTATLTIHGSRTARIVCSGVHEAAQNTSIRLFPTPPRWSRRTGNGDRRLPGRPRATVRAVAPSGTGRPSIRTCRPLRRGLLGRPAGDDPFDSLNRLLGFCKPLEPSSNDALGPSERVFGPNKPCIDVLTELTQRPVGHVGALERRLDSHQSVVDLCAQIVECLVNRVTVNRSAHRFDSRQPLVDPRAEVRKRGQRREMFLEMADRFCRHRFGVSAPLEAASSPMMLSMIASATTKTDHGRLAAWQARPRRHEVVVPESTRRAERCHVVPAKPARKRKSTKSRLRARCADPRRVADVGRRRRYHSAGVRRLCALRQRILLRDYRSRAGHPCGSPSVRIAK